MSRTETKSRQIFKIVLVEDHPMFREHLCQLISKEPGMTVCGEADNIRDAMDLIRAQKPDVAIVDITLRGGSSGLELVKDLKAQALDVNVLVLSMHDEELYAERALRAGAKGYITKNEASAEVIKAVRTVMSGEVYASKKITARLLERITRRRPLEKSSMEALADRELEVFQMLGQGKSTREIAAALNLGESTVETYRARIKEKLQLRSAAELYLRAGQWVREHGA